ncbi:MAG: hypothetical protein QOJ73_6522, partial [Streptosporangiaceae bacterium]|nr:hypothetical protein [Streptosporangiaceae bacterium]
MSAPPELPGQDRQLRWLIFTRHRRLAGGGEDRVERVSELPGAVAEQEP